MACCQWFEKIVKSSLDVVDILTWLVVDGMTNPSNLLWCELIFRRRLASKNRSEFSSAFLDLMLSLLGGGFPRSVNFFYFFCFFKDEI